MELDGKTYYAMGDTDVTDEAKLVNADASVADGFVELLKQGTAVQRFW